MKIGIYLAYGPHKKDFSLKQEGLGRYMAALLKAFCENDYRVTVACPKWSLDTLNELLEDNNISKDKIDFVYPSSTPIILDLYLRWSERKKSEKKRRKSRITRAAINILDQMINVLLSVKNVTYFALIVVGMTILSILLLPIGLLSLIVIFFATIILKIWSFFNHKKYSLVNIIKSNKVLAGISSHIHTKYSTLEVLERFRLGSAKDIIRKINAMVQKPDLWYCPMAFWPEFNRINGVKVVCAPDLVTEQFVYDFSRLNVRKATDDVRKTIEGGKYFIAYCNYLKQTLLIDKFGKREKDVVAIPHALNTLDRYIDVSSCFQRDGFPYDVNMRYARAVLKSAAGNIMDVQHYMASGVNGFSLDDVSYIFYASQVRSNKNILNLVKAYEKLLKEKNMPIKLFLTANINNDQQLHDYIYERNLQYDVLFFYSVTSQQLAALYKCADLVVNPTFYEGGFPFTFGEGMSVGTPSVMSKIPQVTEVLNERDFGNILFDPYDVEDMANKIAYGLQHRDEIYQKQEKVFASMNERTWEDVGREYVEAFKYFIERQRQGSAS